MVEELASLSRLNESTHKPFGKGRSCFKRVPNSEAHEHPMSHKRKSCFRIHLQNTTVDGEPGIVYYFTLSWAKTFGRR